MTWNKPENKQPDVDPKYGSLTKDVDVVTNKGKRTKAFCHIPSGKWLNAYTLESICEGVMKWRE